MGGLQITGTLSCVFTVDVTNLTLPNRHYEKGLKVSAEVTRAMTAQISHLLKSPVG